MTDELRDAILNPDDRVLYDEAQLCLSANADRAAFIISWIAATEGILGKLRIMAQHHSALGTFLRSFEAAQQSGTAKDSDLVSKAFEVGLITKTERIELDALRDLRNQYGHPTATAPSHASAVHALRTAVGTVLSKPPLLMHGAAKELAKRVSTDRHLVPQDEGAIDKFTLSRVGVIYEDARPLFIRELFAGAHEQLSYVNGEQLAERCLRIITVALREWAEPLTVPKWNVDGIQQAYPSAAADVFSQPGVWQLIQEEDQDRILSLCLDSSIGDKFTIEPSRLLERADHLDMKGLLTKSQQERMRTAFLAANPWRLIFTKVRIEHAVRAIIRELSDTSFTAANDGVKAFRAMRRDDFGQLDRNLQRELGMKLAYAAQNNAFAAINEIESMATEPEVWPTDLRAGVVIGGLIGKWHPLPHQRTSKAALRLALADTEGTLAQDALDALTPKMRGTLPPALPELRSVLDNEPSTPAAEKLREFLDRIEYGDNDIR